MSRLWDKGAPLDGRVLAYTAGEDHALDDRLVPYDVRASIVHAEGLHAAGLLSHADLSTLTNALQAAAEAHARGEWRVQLEQEDGQTALEAQLVARAGEAGGRIHLGRSRNDQVLSALRLYLRDAVAQVASGAEQVAQALDRLAMRHPELPLPGYTHLQQAMPSSVALWAGGFAAEVRDDATGVQTVLRRLGKSPLGSAAGYGTPALPLDREATAQRLGFAEAHTPVTAVQISRGKAEAQLLFEIALLMTDLGRLSADLMLYYTQEFAFVKLPDAFTTGSSIMPQACLHEALGIIAKLTSGYHRDLQLLKVPVFRGIDLAIATTDLLPVALDGVTFMPENIHLDPSIHAAEQANRLVIEEGIPFREAYRRVGAQLFGKK